MPTLDVEYSSDKDYVKVKMTLINLSDCNTNIFVTDSVTNTFVKVDCNHGTSHTAILRFNNIETAKEAVKKIVSDIHTNYNSPCDYSADLPDDLNLDIEFRRVVDNTIRITFVCFQRKLFRDNGNYCNHITVDDNYCNYIPNLSDVDKQRTKYLTIYGCKSNDRAEYIAEEVLQETRKRIEKYIKDREYNSYETITESIPINIEYVEKIDPDEHTRNLTGGRKSPNPDTFLESNNKIGGN